MSATEVREMIDSGVVKTIAFAPHVHMSYGTAESATWWSINLNPSTVNCPVVVNTDVFQYLSNSLRDVLMGSADEAVDYYVANDEGATMDK